MNEPDDHPAHCSQPFARGWQTAASPGTAVPVMRCLVVGLVIGIAAGIIAPNRLHAQVGVPVLDTLIWEGVAVPEDPYERRDVYGIGFCGDTLVSTRDFELYALRDGGPGYPAESGMWQSLSRFPIADAGCRSIAGRSILYVEQSSTISRSLDGGQTLERVLVNGRTIPVPTPTGALVGYFNSPGYEVCRTDDGEAWECHGYVPGDRGFPRVFAAARPGGLIPASRLLANGQGGPAYSDDDGRTWQPSDLMTDIQTVGWGLAVVDGGPLHGLGVAVAQGLQPNGFYRYSIFQSTDGVTWTDVGPAPGGWYIELAALPGGLLVAYDSGKTVGTWLSGDGGRTWQIVYGADGLDATLDAAPGPDGRLYIGVFSGSTYWENERGGVYRTTTALSPVASAPPPAEAPIGVAVSVRPNPAGGRVEVVVSLAAAQAVRMVVLDALGREVAVVLDGAVAAGDRVTPVNTGSWPAGVYVVRATAGAQVASARLVVAR